MEAQDREVEYYETKDGKNPFRQWYSSLRDRTARNKIDARIRRVEFGNLGHCEPVGEGVMAKTKGRTYKEDRLEKLKDPEEAVEYLKACMEETDMAELFLVALKDIAEARSIGMSKLARNAHLNRENLYTMLSKQGNPELASLTAILGALGLKLSIELKEAS